MTNLVVSRPLTGEPMKSPADPPPALIPVTSAGRRVVEQAEEDEEKGPGIAMVRILTGLMAFHQFIMLASPGSRGPAPCCGTHQFGTPRRNLD